MKSIHRKEIDNLDHPFKAPKNVTFGWQARRNKFSVWFDGDDDSDAEYIIVGTGHDFLGGKLKATFVMPDGFLVFHLIELP